MKHIKLFEQFVNEASKADALSALKSWADSNIVLIKNKKWQPGAYMPDGKNSVGNLVGAVTGEDEFYFDDNDFVQGDKTIFRVEAGKSTSKDLYDKLVDLRIL